MFLSLSLPPNTFLYPLSSSLLSQDSNQTLPKCLTNKKGKDKESIYLNPRIYLFHVKYFIGKYFLDFLVFGFEKYFSKNNVLCLFLVKYFTGKLVNVK
jgi:hypothetical protein